MKVHEIVEETNVERDKISEALSKSQTRKSKKRTKKVQSNKNQSRRQC